MSEIKPILKPFLRWVGGKQRIVKYLLPFVPRKYNNYHEPFLGSGALFFAIYPKKAYLADRNDQLINCYRFIRDEPVNVYRHLIEHVSKTSEEYYYNVRREFNENGNESVEQAGRFIYLNRTNFNGIYRVNLQGKYNVPYGKKEPPPIPLIEDLIKASAMLKHAELNNYTFQNSMKQDLNRDDFFYLDPPYPPITRLDSSFNHYTNKRFSWELQRELAITATSLIDDCYIMISNSDIPEIRELYKSCDKKWIFHTLSVRRFVSANGKRKNVDELIITNY